MKAEQNRAWVCLKISKCMQPHRDPFQAMSHADLQQILFDFFSPHIREREKMKSLMACRAHSTILTNIFGHYAIHGDSLSRLTSPSCEQWRKLSTSVDSLVILWTEWELLSDQPHRLLRFVGATDLIREGTSCYFIELASLIGSSSQTQIGPRAQRHPSKE